MQQENSYSIQNKIQPEQNNQNKKIIWLVAAGVVILGLIILGAVLVPSTRDKKDTTDLDKSLEQMAQDLKEQEKRKVPPRLGTMMLDYEDDEEYQVGHEIQVNILLDTQKSDIVVAQAVIEYDPKMLEFIGENQMANTEDSVLDMSIANLVTPGRIEVVRGTPGDTDYLDSDDGFNGRDGLLASLEFEILKAGEIEINFDEDESSMVLDDGRGTVMVMGFEDIVFDVE